MRLAKALGYKSVREAQDSLSSQEFAEWMAYDRLAPLDSLERLVAQLLTLTANVNRDPKRHPQPFSVEEFMPDPFVPTLQERRARYTQVMAEFAANREKRKQKPN